MSGQALTASELAYIAGVAAATASGHLALLDGGVLAVEKQGRHRYYRLAGPEDASAIEALMNLAEQSGQDPSARVREILKCEGPGSAMIIWLVNAALSVRRVDAT
jgi:DNA-binding transcriptional ArsR family regulator